MSDDPATFRAKTRAMTERAQEALDKVGRAFISHMAADVIDTTPGPNLQLPDTEYIATGRLRAGWSWSTTAQNMASRWDGGPYTEHGEDTLAAIEAALAAVRDLPRLSYLQNDVAYGIIVHEGLGRQPYARPWVKEAAGRADRHAAAARAEVTGG